MRSAIGRGTDATGLWSILKLAASDWLRHRSPRLGAALAYYSVFSLGPLLLIVTAIAGLIWGGDGARSSIVSQFRALVGESGGQAIEAMLQGASSSVAGGWSAVIGVSLLLVAAIGVVVQLKDALNTIFEVSEPKNAGASWYVKVYGGAFAGIPACRLPRLECPTYSILRTPDRFHHGVPLTFAHKLRCISWYAYASFLHALQVAAG